MGSVRTAFTKHEPHSLIPITLRGKDREAGESSTRYSETDGQSQRQWRLLVDEEGELW